jgi:hypothetical protein
MTFDEAKQQSEKAWQEMLGRIDVRFAKDEDMKKFYTGLYHAILGRGLCSDVNGAYPRHDGGIGQLPMKDGKPLHNMYNTDAFWGGQWNLGQLWILAYPEYTSDYISSHLQVFKDAGWMGDGLANSRYVSGVGTNQLPLLINAAYQCGIRDFDVQLAYEACRKNELDGKDAAYLVKHGVILVGEGANMPSTPDAIETFLKAKVLFSPGKASNAGGVATSGLEMSQNSERMTWTSEQVDAKLKGIMKAIHDNAYEAAAKYGKKGNYVVGANIAGFVKVADAMVAQGIV